MVDASFQLCGDQYPASSCPNALTQDLVFLASKVDVVAWAFRLHAFFTWGLSDQAVDTSERPAPFTAAPSVAVSISD
jgi:hypothetical protein